MKNRIDTNLDRFFPSSAFLQMHQNMKAIFSRQKVYEKLRRRL